MKAVRLASAEARTLETAEIPPPQPGAGELLLEVVTVGLCHTDVGMVRGAEGLRRGYRPSFPLVPGHEYHGVIVGHGPGVDAPPLGTRVVGSAHVTCRTCRWCRSGRSMLCERLEVIGLDRDGAFAERMVVPAVNVVPVPNSLSDEVVGLAEPFAVALHAIELADVKDTDRVAVIGPGAVGLLTVAALGDTTVTVIGTPADQNGLAKACELGANQVHIGTEALAGDFDVVIEAAGHASAVEMGASLLAYGGRMVCVGLPATSASVDTAMLARREQSLIGSRAYDLSTWASVPQALRDRAEVGSLVTHQLPLDEAERAIELVEARRALKVLLRPSR